ncbi:hypothetical protein HHX47_DHR12000013 [Lentinula edodes]|nr:hypothetical protein HHX47_DHR12000013 [Lentinula edodes]
MSFDTTRKNSMASLCHTIRQNQRDNSGNGSFDSFDDLLRQHAMELGEDEPSSSGIVSSTALSKRTQNNTSTRAAQISYSKDPLLAGSPIDFSSGSSSSSDADADGETDEELYAQSDDSSSDSSESDSDVDFMILDYVSVEPEDAPFIPQPTQPVHEHDSVAVFASDYPAASSPRLAPSDPLQFTSPFHSPTLPHRAFTPGPFTVLATEIYDKAAVDPTPPMNLSATSMINPLQPVSKRKRVPTSSKRTSKARATTISDDDDEYRNNASDDDDEYAPSPPLAPKSRRRRRTVAVSRHRISRRKQGVSPSSTSSRPTSSRSTPKRRRIAPESRNEQSDSPVLLDAIANTSVEICDFICPVCGWEQSNKRMPDYQRHLKTHLRPDREDKTKGWWCKGVRLEDKDEFNVKCEVNGSRKVRDDADPYWFHDHMRVGGCCQTFSRRDALKRHMANPNVRCGGIIAEGLKEGDD